MANWISVVVVAVNVWQQFYFLCPKERKKGDWWLCNEIFLTEQETSINLISQRYSTVCRRFFLPSFFAPSAHRFSPNISAITKPIRSLTRASLHVRRLFLSQLLISRGDALLALFLPPPPPLLRCAQSIRWCTNRVPSPSDSVVVVVFFFFCSRSTRYIVPSIKMMKKQHSGEISDPKTAIAPEPLLISYFF